MPNLNLGRRLVAPIVISPTALQTSRFIIPFVKQHAIRICIFGAFRPVHTHSQYLISRGPARCAFQVRSSQGCGTGFPLPSLTRAAAALSHYVRAEYLNFRTCVSIWGLWQYLACRNLRHRLQPAAPAAKRRGYRRKAGCRVQEFSTPSEFGIGRRPKIPDARAYRA